MKYGDKVEIAFWLGGDETTEHVRQFMQDVGTAMKARADAANVVMSEPLYTFKLPGEPKVPDTPKWLDRKCAQIGRKQVSVTIKGKLHSYLAPVLLVAEAEVVQTKPKFAKRTFTADLSVRDLSDLRRATRRALKRPDLSSAACDDIIEQVGPDAAFGAVLNTLGNQATKH